MQVNVNKEVTYELVLNNEEVMALYNDLYQAVQGAGIGLREETERVFLELDRLISINGGE